MNNHINIYDKSGSLNFYNSINLIITDVICNNIKNLLDDMIAEKVSLIILCSDNATYLEEFIDQKIEDSGNFNIATLSFKKNEIDEAVNLVFSYDYDYTTETIFERNVFLYDKKTNKKDIIKIYTELGW